jgi:hypothetical protein
MRRRFNLARLSVLASLLASTLISNPSLRGDEALPEPITTNERRFEIPVQIEAGDPTIAEVRLYASKDAGKTWEVVRRQAPPLNGFSFEATADGEYWFLLRTADAMGREADASAMTPELCVLVDAEAPQLDVVTERTEDGKLLIRWQSTDRHLQAESLRITYRTSALAKWQDVQSLRTKRQGDDRSAGGEMEWTSPGDEPGLTIRAEIRDAAGNLTVKELQSADLAASKVAAVAAPASPNITAVATVAPANDAVPSPRDSFRPLWVNSLSFELDYETGRVPAAAIEQVAVWGTRDDGRTWVQLGVDEDRRSPCAVNVDREGMYGFAVIVTSGATESAKPPRPGDAPEIRVGVDLKKPQVRLTTAEPDDQGRPCMLKINWVASDEHLGAQAVSLAYGAGPQGPWLPLALGVANDGSRVCEFDAQGPNSAYLRIEVRDEAGNLGAFSTTTPIPIEKNQMQIRVAGATGGEQPKSTPKWFHVLR